MNPEQRPEPLAESPQTRTYRWPWFVLIAVIAALVLAFLWMRHEVERTRQLRDLNQPAPTAPLPR